MAEQFLNRLNKIEDSINQLGETLKRMITILSTMTEIKSEIRVSKEEILNALGSQKAAMPPSDDHTDEFAKMVVQEVGAVRVFIQQSSENLRNEMVSILEEMLSNIQDAKISVQAPPAKEVPAPVSAPQEVASHLYEDVEPQVSSSLPANKAMKIADELNTIMNSLKMGCIAGDVLETLNAAKASIMSTVPSDQIMVRIDKWVGLVGGYTKRHELQARDVIKLKKELKEEIQRYSLG